MAIMNKTPTNQVPGEGFVPKRFYPIILLAGALLLLLTALGSRGIILSEARRLALAADILRNGRWLVPHLLDKPYPFFPPLFPWIIVAISRMSGAIDLLTARTVSIGAGIALLFVTYSMAKVFLDHKTAWLAPTMLLTNYIFYTFARQARPEMMLALFVTLSFFMFWKAYIRKPASKSAPWFFFLFMVLAGYVKGWAFTYYLGLGLSLYAILTTDRGFLRRLSFYVALAGAFAVVGAWFLYASTQTGETAILSGLHRNSVEKIMGEGFDPLNILKSIVYILGSSFPWTVPVLLGLRAGFKERTSERGRGILLIFSWVAACLAVFCLLMESHERYLVAVWPAAMILGALYLAKIWEAEGRAWATWRGFALVMVALNGVLVVTAPFFAYFVFSISNSLQMISGMAPPVIVFLPAVRALRRGTIRGVNFAIACSFGAMLLIVAVYHSSNPNQYEEAAYNFKNRFGAGREAVVYHSKGIRLRMEYYLNRQLPSIYEFNDLERWFAQRPQGVILIYKGKLVLLKQLNNVTIITLGRSHIHNKSIICAVVHSKQRQSRQKKKRGDGPAGTNNIIKPPGGSE